VSIDHVTADKVGNSFLTLDGGAMQRLAITNSILPEGQYGIKGSGRSKAGRRGWRSPHRTARSAGTSST
jgi:hypothetical protein